MRMAGRLPWAIRLGLRVRGCWCIWRIASRGAGWRLCAWAVGWVVRWWWSARNCDSSFHSAMLSPGNERHEIPAADWTPTPEFIATTNVAWLMRKTGMATYEELHAWSVRQRAEYWGLAIERLGVRFQRPFREVVDLSRGVEAPEWLPGARMNIVESCFAA